jgi:apolipoprotein D and lipocalin family protein
MKKIINIPALLIVGCVGIPDGVKPVDHFQVERYLGKWYEIARLDHQDYSYALVCGPDKSYL